MPRAVCPICGHGYVGTLEDHQTRNAAADGSPGPVTRCDWNLHTLRVARAAEALQAAGFVRADSVAARVVVELHDPDLAVYGPTGNVQPFVSYNCLAPENWPRIWWTRRWCKALAEVTGWRMTERRQRIREVAKAPQDVRDVIEAVYRIGGPVAVEALGTQIAAPRCTAQGPWPARHHVGPKTRDRCLLAEGHAEGHRGIRGTRWR